MKRYADKGVQEAHTGIVELKEEDPDLVRAMVEWMYTSAYVNQEDRDGRQPMTEGHGSFFICDKGKALDSEGVDGDERPHHAFNEPGCCLWRFGLAIGMIKLADKYDIPPLRTFACKRFEALTVHVRGVNFLTSSAELQLIENAYNASEPKDDLRECMRSHVILRLGQRPSVPRTGLRDYKGFNDLLAEVPDLLSDVLEHFLPKYIY